MQTESAIRRACDEEMLPVGDNPPVARSVTVTTPPLVGDAPGEIIPADTPSPSGKKSFLKAKIRLLTLFVKMSAKDLLNSGVNLKLSFFSVCFVVSLCTVLISVLTMMPAVFLLLGQSERGAADLILSSNGFYGKTLNYSVVDRVMAKTGDSSLDLNSPRIDFDAELYPLKGCNKNLASASQLWYPAEAYGDVNSICYNGCLDYWCPLGGSNLRVVAVDFEKEKSLGIYSSKVTVTGNEVVLTDDVAGTYGLGAGDTVFLRVRLSNTFSEVLQRLQQTTLQKQNNVFIVSLKVKHIVEADGEMVSDADSYALIDIGSLSSLIANDLGELYEKEQVDRVRQLPARGYSSSVLFRIPENIRDNIYVQANYNKIRASFYKWSNKVTKSLPLHQVNVNTPILTFLKTMDFFISFIGLIMTVVVFVVGCMSVLLINSLLSVLLESKMFDLGIQRMLGLSSVDIVMLVLTNTYVFAVPAWFVGLIAGQLLYVLVSLLFQWETDIQLGYFVTLSSIGWSTLIAFLIPLLSSILPTRRLLNRQLADSLNSERNMESGVIYKIEQKGKQSFNRVNFGIGVLVFSFGAFAYLVLPSSLLSQNLTEMFFVFYSLLLGMLFGFVLLVLNYQRLIEGVVLHVFLFWEKSAVFNIVGKNLIFHRLRNRRTTLMYSLSLTFIIFVSVAFELESDSLVFGVSRDAGADINIRISGYDSRGRLSLKREVDMDSEKFALVDRFSQIPMTLDSLGGVLQAVSEKIADGTIAQYSYRLFPINSACAERYINNQRLNTLGRFRDLTTGIRPIAPSMFNVLFDKYQVVRKVDDDVARYGLSETLYTTANRDGVILSTSAFDHLGFDTLSDIGVVRTVAKPGVRLTGSTQGFTVAAVMDSAPVVLMNRYPGSLGDVLASIPSGAKFSMIPYFSVRSLFVNQIFFQVPDPEQYKTVTSWVESYLFQKHSYWFRNIEEQLKNFVMARGVLFYFFLVCEVMILFLCFFSLSSSMSLNIMSSTKEIGIMLALGISRFELYRIFIWEALLIVLSSAVVGISVGLFVAFVLQMQTVLFTQLPLSFFFPWPQLLITIAIGLGSSVLSSYAPLRRLLASPSISSILRKII